MTDRLDALALVLLLVSPAVLVASLTFPFYWIAQYVMLRKTGAGYIQKTYQARWIAFTAAGILGLYGLGLIALVSSRGAYAAMEFLESGWILALGVPLLVDGVVFVLLLPDAAMAKWREEQRLNRR